MAISKKPMTRRALNALETKQRLFHTALELFSQYGYDKVTVEDITRRAGFSKGTFYAHFPSKEAILLEQFRMIDASYEKVFATVPANMSVWDRVLLLIHTMCDYCANEVGVEPLQVIYANQILSPNSIRILNDTERPVYRILRETAALGKERCEIPQDVDNASFAEMIMRFARGLLYDWCMYDGAFDLQEEGNRYFKSIVHALYPCAGETNSRSAD